MEEARMTGPTRRELLAAFLGVPAALAGCSSRDADLFPQGDIVGASAGIGHRIRDGLRLELPAEAHERKRVVIVGGGIAGLGAAWHLQRRGLNDFVVLELEEAAGGTARSGSSPLVGYPWGAHYIPAPTAENKQLIELFEEMGVVTGKDAKGQPVVAEQYLCRDPEERIFFLGRWYEGLYLHMGASAEDAAQMKRFQTEVDRWVAWRDAQGRRAFTLPVAYASDDAEVAALDKITMADWLNQRNFTSERLRWWVDYACRDDYGMTIDQASAWAGLFYFCARVPKAGVESQPFVTWPEGNGRVVQHLRGRVKDRVRLGQAVIDVAPTETGVDVLACDHSGTKVAGYRAERVIFAAPQFMTRYLIRPYRQNPPAHVKEFEYGSWLVANLHLRDRPASRGFPLCWDNVIYDSPSLGYVVATHQQLRDHGPTVFTYYYPLCDDDPKVARQRLLDMDWRACADIALADLQRPHHEIRRLTERLDVMRWGHAMIRPRPGFQAGTARRAAARPFQGIHFAHSDLSGVALFEEALHHGVRAADEVAVALA
ncbi:MAG: FAD-dependent oxidoreductase [Gemmataceae bacterium]